MSDSNVGSDPENNQGKIGTKVIRPQLQLVDKINSQRDSIGFNCPSFQDHYRDKKRPNDESDQQSMTDISEYGTV